MPRLLLVGGGGNYGACLGAPNIARPQPFGIIEIEAKRQNARFHLEPSGVWYHYPVMRRALWFRSLATFLAVWFPLVIGEPGVLHPCPMHGAGAAHATMHHAGMQDAAMHHGAMHDGAMHDAPSGAPAAPHHDHSGCTCITCCSVSVAGLLAPDVPASTIDVVVRSVIAALPPATQLPQSSATHVRPYPTGPPAQTLLG